MKDLWIGFVEGFSREWKESLKIMEKLEGSSTDLGSRVGGLHHSGIRVVEQVICFL